MTKININNVMVGVTEVHNDDYYYETLSDLRFALRNGLVDLQIIDDDGYSVNLLDLVAYHGVVQHDDIIDDYLCQEYGWDGSVATLHRIEMV